MRIYIYIYIYNNAQEKRSAAVLDSAKQNLASSFVNAFVNAGFCKDARHISALHWIPIGEHAFKLERYRED